jgi:hypothetical protein
MDKSTAVDQKMGPAPESRANRKFIFRLAIPMGSFGCWCVAFVRKPSLKKTGHEAGK